MSFRLRRMIKDQKSTTKDVQSPRINSPLAKYENGELKCLVCDSIVRSEKAWPVHINSKKHKENIVLAKELKEKIKDMPLTSNNHSVKRPATPPPQVVSQPVKKLKGILKNSNGKKEEEETREEKEYIDKSLVKINRVPGGSGPKPEKMEVEEQPNELPDGFFDNPREDAKVRKFF